MLSTHVASASAQVSVLKQYVSQSQCLHLMTSSTGILPMRPAVRVPVRTPIVHAPCQHRKPTQLVSCSAVALDKLGVHDCSPWSISIVVLPLIAALAQFRLGDVEVCTFEDRDQVPAVYNSFHGTSVNEEAFSMSRLYRQWSECTMFKMTRCRRSDEDHFNFYRSIPTDLKQAISQIKRDLVNLIKLTYISPFQ